jgi:hypothetical protein
MIIKCESVKTHYYYTTTEIASTDKNNISWQNLCVQTMHVWSIHVLFIHVQPSK